MSDSSCVSAMSCDSSLDMMIAAEAQTLCPSKSEDALKVAEHCKTVKAKYVGIRSKADAVDKVVRTKRRSVCDHERRSSVTSKRYRKHRTRTGRYGTKQNLQNLQKKQLAALLCWWYVLVLLRYPSMCSTNRRRRLRMPLSHPWMKSVFDVIDVTKYLNPGTDPGQTAIGKKSIKEQTCRRHRLIAEGPPGVRFMIAFGHSCFMSEIRMHGSTPATLPYRKDKICIMWTLWSANTA